jgi:hypothetical protein
MRDVEETHGAAFSRRQNEIVALLREAGSPSRNSRRISR